MGCGGGLSRSKAHCFDPDIDPEQESKATSQTGRGIGNSQGCFKPENQRLCGVGPPGPAIAGSPRAEWEKVYGKLRTIITRARVPICMGHSTGIVTVVERIPDGPPAPKSSKRVRCCAIRYKSCPTNC